MSFCLILGLVPLNFIHVHTGLALNNITEFGANLKQIAILFGLSFLALVPSLVCKEKDKGEKENQKKKNN